MTRLLKKVKRFIRERNAAYLSMDQGTIRQWAQKNNVILPTEELAFWYYVNREIACMDDARPDQREHSMNWLREHMLDAGLHFVPVEEGPYQHLF